MYSPDGKTAGHFGNGQIKLWIGRTDRRRVISRDCRVPVSGLPESDRTTRRHLAEMQESLDISIRLPSRDPSPDDGCTPYEAK